MKTLLLSDIHIGDPRYKSDRALTKLINSETFDQIILVGDTVDLWMPWYKKECKKSKFLKAINKLNSKIIWVIGNHDHGLDVRSLVPRATACDKYIFVDKQRFLAIHGHQVYPFQNMGWHNKILSVINAYIYKWFNIDFQWFRNKWLFRSSAEKRRFQMIDKYGNLCDTMIIGHTHIQTYQTKNGIDLYDLGSIVLGNTYGIIEDGIFRPKKL